MMDYAGYILSKHRPILSSQLVVRVTLGIECMALGKIQIIIGREHKLRSFTCDQVLTNKVQNIRSPVLSSTSNKHSRLDLTYQSIVQRTL